MAIRNPAAFALSMLCLATSASLGVLIHDGAVNAPSIHDAEPGDDVRFRATADDAGSMRSFLQTWSFHGRTVDLLVLDDGHHVIVLHDGEPLDDGAWVVDGTLRARMAHGGHTMSIVDAATVTAPLLFD